MVFKRRLTGRPFKGLGKPFTGLFEVFAAAFTRRPLNGLLKVVKAFMKALEWRLKKNRHAFKNLFMAFKRHFEGLQKAPKVF